MKIVDILIEFKLQETDMLNIREVLIFNYFWLKINSIQFNN